MDLGDGESEINEKRRPLPRLRFTYILLGVVFSTRCATRNLAENVAGHCKGLGRNYSDVINHCTTSHVDADPGDAHHAEPRYPQLGTGAVDDPNPFLKGPDACQGHTCGLGGIPG